MAVGVSSLESSVAEGSAFRRQRRWRRRSSSGSTLLRRRQTKSIMSVTRTTRQGMASGVSSTDPLYGLYASETVWATQTNRLRQQFYAAEGSAATSYNSAWRTATNQLRLSLMTDEIACSNAGFEAYKTLSQDLTGASTNYTLATYDAESSRILAQISIESAKSYADASSRAALSRERADAFSEALADVLDEFDAAGFENQTTLNALIGTGVTDGSAYATGKPLFRILVFFDCTFIDNSILTTPEYRVRTSKH